MARLIPTADETGSIPGSVFTAPSGTAQFDDWIILKALIVLYAYSELTPLSQTSKTVKETEISYWPLRSIVEVLALRLSLHRSVQDLRLDLQSGSEHIEDAPSYQRYTIWLWLFNMAHYCSIVSGQ